MISIIFDQYQRYKNAQILINSIRKDNETFRILEVGANSHKNLEKFLPDDDVTYLDISIPEELQNDPSYIQGDATAMEFESNSYDIVLALDVFEHIPENRRTCFIDELYRVCKKIAIISAPFDSTEVVLSEERANSYYKSMIGIDHLWLYEHINYGLPSEKNLIKYIRERNIRYSYFRHGSLSIWEKLTNAQVLKQLNNDLSDYITEIDKYYNSFAFQYDYDENGYRSFFILEKEREVKIDLVYDESYKSGVIDLLDNLNNLFQLKMSLGEKLFNLPRDCENTLKAYFDYGNGFSEENSECRYLNLYTEQRVVFDKLNERDIKCLRIDPTETQGKFIFRNLVVTDENDQQINDVTVTSNCDIKEGCEYTFLKRDPQILINLDNVNISSISFSILKFEKFSKKEELLDDILLKLLNKTNQIEEINSKLLEEVNNIITKKNCSKFKK